jgi:hypothetical protein
LRSEVEKKYSKNWNGKTFENTGETPLFDKLTNKQ